MLELHLEKTTDDARGKIIMFNHNGKKINIIEIKKSFARGGHFHPFPTEHVLILGTVEYREENIQTKKEEIRIIRAPSVIKTAPNIAHLFVALDDVVFAEVFDKDYSATNYPKYRNIVEKKLG